MANPVSTITYGTFVFPYNSLDVNSGVLYADDGFTQIGVRYLFTVSGWIGGVSQTDLNTQLQTMEGQLRTPRQNFSVQWAGDAGTQTFYSFGDTATSSGSDLDWGPKPGDLQIMRISGGRAAMYRWSVVVISKGCGSLGTNAIKSDVLAITWNFDHRVDPSGYTTRTVSGKLLIDANSVQSNTGSDHFRQIIITALPVPLWFKRESQNFTQSEDGRVLSFSIVDAEKQWTLPTPVTVGSASWTVRQGGLTGDGGLAIDYVLSGSFETSAAHNKSDLLTAVMSLITQRFGGLKGIIIPGDRSIREDVYANRIDFTIAAQGWGGVLPNGDPDYSIGLETFGLQPTGSDGRPLAINPYGQSEQISSGIQAGSPILYDACAPPSGGYQFVSASTDGGTTTYDSRGSSRTPPSPEQGSQAGVSKMQLANPFIAIHEQISYELNNGIKIFYPKVASKPSIKQQASSPTLKIIQAGYFTQIATSAAEVSPPNPPLPFGKNNASSNVAILTSYVSAATPEGVGDGSVNSYTVHWRYVMEWLPSLNTPNLADAEPGFPTDPRRPVPSGAGGNGGSLPTLPNIVSIPTSQA